MKTSSVLIFIAAVLLLPLVVVAEEIEPKAGTGGRMPDRYGFSLEGATIYDPDFDRGFVLLTGFALFDYGKVWNQDRPKELGFKVEAAAGGTIGADPRTVASAGMLALYYLDPIATPRLRPYLEGGIGLIYTDFRVEKQAYRFNFNPQLGIGTEFIQKNALADFVALRLHHLSNANLGRDNRGVNSLILQIGSFF